MRRARVPISRFPVGAVGLGMSGCIYASVNLEFRGLPLSHSVHAEQFLVVNAAAVGKSKLCAIAISHMPCGHCRQFLQEIRGAGGIRIIVTSSDAKWRTVSSLLPRPFGPHDLLPKHVPLVLEPHDSPLVGNPATAVITNGFANGDLEARLREAAEAAARAAHTPYSECPSRFAVADGKGPMQAAIIGMVAAGGAAAAEDVVAAALVEKEAALVSQEAMARIFLAAVAPQASFHVYNFGLSDA
ncbi:hypothetical protein OsI_23685 [Oryza sativa Indica Group]|uniref:cytidine deaminase n=1 Tax=Oryza sativa subsp. indica TaxID=39946 RepID=B8B4K8_ORYSI|nr:hypothetical protein OsI_23685 [Oryza sativa Indica Group]